MENISWQILEYKKNEKTNDWYWAVIIIALSVVVISFIENDGLFAVFVIIATAMLIMFSLREPKLITVTLDSRGFVVDKDMYPFASIESFWIDISDTNEPKILLKSKKTFVPLIVIPIQEYHHLDIRNLLLLSLPEVEHHEPLSQKIFEKLGF